MLLSDSLWSAAPMSHDLALTLPPNHSALLTADSADRVREYLASVQARNTIRGYRSSFRQFESWCRVADLPALPATSETAALYLAAQANRLTVSTLEHHLAAIRKAHQAAGLELVGIDHLLVAETLKGIK